MPEIQKNNLDLASDPVFKNVAGLAKDYSNSGWEKSQTFTFLNSDGTEETTELSHLQTTELLNQAAKLMKELKKATGSTIDLTKPNEVLRRAADSTLSPVMFTYSPDQEEKVNSLVQNFRDDITLTCEIYKEKTTEFAEFNSLLKERGIVYLPGSDSSIEKTLENPQIAANLRHILGASDILNQLSEGEAIADKETPQFYLTDTGYKSLLYGHTSGDSQVYLRGNPITDALNKAAVVNGLGKYGKEEGLIAEYLYGGEYKPARVTKPHTSNPLGSIEEVRRISIPGKMATSEPVAGIIAATKAHKQLIQETQQLESTVATSISHTITDGKLLPSRCTWTHVVTESEHTPNLYEDPDHGSRRGKTHHREVAETTPESTSNVVPVRLSSETYNYPRLFEMARLMRGFQELAGVEPNPESISLNIDITRGGPERLYGPQPDKFSMEVTLPLSAELKAAQKDIEI